MNERGKSDNLVVPAKPPNNAGGPVAEVVEGRGLAEGNTDSSTRPGRSAGQGVPSGLDRVREVARRDKEARFTALLHHVDLDRLWAAYAGDQPEGRAGGRSGDVGRLRAGSASEPRRPAPPCPQRCLPGEPFSQGVHTETGRAAAPARYRHLGGQDPPACGGGGIERRIRGGLSRLLLRVPARAWPARCAGCARGRDHREESELDTRR